MSVGYGLNFLASFAYFDRSTSSWKTCLGYLFEGLETYSEIWPRSGLIVNGTAYRLPRLVPRILGGGYFFWPTPRSTDSSHGGRITPRSSREGGNLIEALSARMPTPRADLRDNCGGTNSRRSAKAAGTYIGRQLNPEFVEYLMGFPIGWSDLEDSATP